MWQTLILRGLFTVYKVIILSSCRWGWWWWRMRRGEAPLLLRLRHAFPHRLLESPLRLRPAHRLLERVGMFRGVNPHDRPPDGFHRRPSIPLRLHRRTQRLRHSRGVCGAGHFSARWEKEGSGRQEKKHTYDFGVSATHVYLHTDTYYRMRMSCASVCAQGYDYDISYNYAE